MLTGLRPITIKLDLDNRNFHANIEGSAEALARFNRVVKQYSPHVQKAETHTRSWGVKLRDTVIVLGLARHALLNLDALLLSLPRSIIRTNAEFEKMDALMKGLSRETTSYADILKQAERDKTFVIDMALNSPFNIQSLMDSFAKFRSAGIDPTNGSLQALIDSVAKFGGTSQELKRATIAIQQMAGKGTISLEELRQQLGEVIPDAIQIMARGVVMEVGELTQEIAKGTVEADGALRAMFRQMAIENQGSALEMSNTWDGTFARMQTRLELFKKGIGDAGLFDELKKQLTLVTDEALTSPEVMKAAETLGKALTAIVSTFAEGISFVVTYKDEIQILAAVFIAFAAKQRVLSASTLALNAASRTFDKTITGVRGAVNNYRDTVRATIVDQRAAVAAMAMYGETANMQSTAMIRAQVATRGLASTMGRLGTVALGAVGGWAGLLTTTIIGLSTYMYAFRDSYAETVAEIDAKKLELITSDQIEALEKAIEQWDKLEERIDKAKKQAARESAANNSFIPGISELELTAAIGAQEEFEKAVKKNQDEMIKLKEIGKLNELERELNSISRTLELEMNQKLRAATNQYKETLDQIIREGGESAKTRREQLDRELTQLITKLYDERIKKAEEHYDKLKKAGADYASKELTRARRTIDDLRELQKKAVAPFDADPGGIEKNEKEIKKKSEALDRFVRSQENNLAKYNARLKDSNDLLAVFTERLDRGDFGNVSDERKREIEQLLQDLDAAKKKYTEATKEAKKFEQATQKINQIGVSIEQSFARRANTNPYLKESIAADGYRARLEAIRDELSSLTTQSAKSAKEIESINKMLEGLDRQAADATIAKIQAQTDKINNGLLPAQKRIQAEYDQTVKHLREMLAVQGEVFSEEQKQAIEQYLDALDAKRIRDLETPMASLARKWSDTATVMGEIWADTMEGFTEEIARGVIEGEFQFESLLRSFAQMIVQMQVQAAAAGIYQMLFQGTTAAVGAGAATGAQGVGGVPQAQPFLLANGGIMTARGLATLEKYADGGVAYRPQVAVFGEGSQPEAFVPLPDGRTIPVTMNAPAQTASQPSNVSVNLINQSGVPLNAEQKDQRFDGRQMILDVVVEAMNKPGRFRDSIKGAVR